GIELLSPPSCPRIACKDGRVLHPAPPSLGLPVEGCHPCPKPLQDDQRHRWISLLELLMSETGRCLSPVSKARPKRSSDSGTSRSIAAAGTAWRNLPGARC